MKKFLLLSIIALSLLSCSKNNDVTPPGEENQKETKLLVDSVITNDNGYITFLTFKYDNANRMTEMHDHNAVNDYGADYVYSYDVNGYLVKAEINVRGGAHAVYDYTYKNDLLTVKLTQIGQVHTYSINILNDQETGYNVTTLTGESGTAAYKYHNQNLASSYYESFSSTGVKTSTIDVTQEYGTHKNPYLYSGYKMLLPGGPEYAGKNELLKDSILYNGNKTLDTFQYTYDNQGYPTICNKTTTSSSGTTHSAITYKYIKAK